MSKIPDSYCAKRRYCEADTSYCEADTLNSLLTESLRRPTRKTLSLIDKALGYLVPFESPRARTASPHERRELLDLLNTHRQVLMPYMDVDRIESNLRFSR